jgi:hypothetical protein
LGKVTPPGQNVQGARFVGLKVGFNVVGTAVVGFVVVGIDVGLGQQTGSANWTVAHSLSLVKKFAASTAA